MKVHLMHPDRDFDLEVPLPGNREELVDDLELRTLVSAMAAGDPFLLDVASRTLLTGFGADIDTILYRQAVLKDCLANPDLARGLYELAVEAIESRRKHWLGITSGFPGAILRNAVATLETFMEYLDRLRAFAENYHERFQSRGFRKFLAMCRRELTEDYLAEIRGHLRQLKFPYGVLISGSLREGNELGGYALRRLPDGQLRWLSRVRRQLMKLVGQRASAYTFHIPDRDEGGARAVSSLRNRGIAAIADVLGQSSEHVLRLFEMMRCELAFYTGCLNLHERLKSLGERTCFPEPSPAGTGRRHCSGLYDVCLALTLGRSVVGNTVQADDQRLVIITGANKGGKSSFLRAIGVSQLMMQCGMFVGAESFAAETCPAIFTHYKREEDSSMKSGKFDEELSRMSIIADQIVPGSLVLFNESFAATNDREGAVIAGEITRALLECRIKVFFVTHLNEFARDCFDSGADHFLFLRAERREDGTRTFKLTHGEPLETSYGADVYKEVFTT
ncbi:MAG: DNA mismatch repair protein MutS [Gammaproteobacteria bacterium]